MNLAGEYLGLTGTRLDGADLLSCGLATHFVPSQVTCFTTSYSVRFFPMIHIFNASLRTTYFKLYWCSGLNSVKFSHLVTAFG